MRSTKSNVPDHSIARSGNIRPGDSGRVPGDGPECVGSSMASYEKPTRRAAFGVAGAGLIVCFGAPVAVAADFWNRKQPSAWSNEEIERLTTRSPWAKDVNAEFMHD